MFGWVAFAFILLPAIALNTAPMKHRILWAFLVFLAFILYMAMSYANPEAMATQSKGPYAQRYHKLFSRTVGILFVTTELIAIMFTYADPEGGFIRNFAEITATLGATLVPAIGKYAILVEPPLPTETLLKAQATVTIFILASAIAAFLFLIYIIPMPTDEKKKIMEAAGAYQKGKIFTILALPFGVFIGLDAYFGWSDYYQSSSYSARRRVSDCLMMPRCFPHSGDIAIFLSATLKSVGMIGLPVGMLLAIDLARLRKAKS